MSEHRSDERLVLVWPFAILAGLIDAAVPPREQWQNFVLGLVGTGVFLVSSPVARFDPDIAKYCWLLLLPVTILQRPATRMRGLPQG